MVYTPGSENQQIAFWVTPDLPVPALIGCHQLNSWGATLDFGQHPTVFSLPPLASSTLTVCETNTLPDAVTSEENKIIIINKIVAKYPRVFRSGHATADVDPIEIRL